MFPKSSVNVSGNYHSDDGKIVFYKKHSAFSLLKLHQSDITNVVSFYQNKGYA